MQTTVETTEPHVVKLTIEVPADEFGRDLDRTYREIANQIKVPGFRTGKIPKQIIDTQIGRDAVLQEFVSSAVPGYYRKAVGDEELAPITDPDIDVQQLEPGKPFIFSATVEVRPRLSFEESDYTGIRVDKPAVEVTEAEIDDWVERLRERFAELEPVGRPIQQGDFVTVDLTVLRNGEPVEQASRKDYLYEVGSGEVGEKLDVELVGAKAGAILKVSDSLPERFGEELGGAAVEVTALVKDVKTRTLPDPNDDFAKTASEFDTIQALRDDLRTRVTELKEREANAAVRDLVLQAMIDRVEVDLPDSLIDEETEHRIAHARERAERMGTTLEEMLSMQGWDDDRLREDSRAHAIRAITSDLILEGVARSASLDVTAEELGTEIALLAQAYGRDAKAVAKDLERSGQVVTLAGDIIRGKALDLLVERADIQGGAPESGSPSEPEAEDGAAPEDAPEEGEP
ncbi:MAG TPA: trigger factor [Actinomycetota bacterium]|nr:trigger factor [Actinomycetota bacterium]